MTDKSPSPTDTGEPMRYVMTQTGKYAHIEDRDARRFDLGGWTFCSRRIALRDGLIREAPDHAPRCTRCQARIR